MNEWNHEFWSLPRNPEVESLSISLTLSSWVLQQQPASSLLNKLTGLLTSHRTNQFLHTLSVRSEFVVKQATQRHKRNPTRMNLLTIYTQQQTKLQNLFAKVVIYIFIPFDFQIK